MLKRSKGEKKENTIQFQNIKHKCSIVIFYDKTDPEHCVGCGSAVKDGGDSSTVSCREKRAPIMMSPSLVSTGRSEVLRKSRQVWMSCEEIRVLKNTVTQTHTLLYAILSLYTSLLEPNYTPLWSFIAHKEGFPTWYDATNIYKSMNAHSSTLSLT